MKHKFFITLSKKQLAIILAVIVIALIFSAQRLSQNLRKIDGSTNEKRIEYLKSINLVADDSNVTSKDITVPQEFGEVYNQYNSLQKKAGFDLSRYKGKPATVYTYSLSGTDRLIHLIICNDEIIGGDIADANINGSMQPLF